MSVSNFPVFGLLFLILLLSLAKVAYNSIRVSHNALTPNCNDDESTLNRQFQIFLLNGLSFDNDLSPTKVAFSSILVSENKKNSPNDRDGQRGLGLCATTASLVATMAVSKLKIKKHF
jgi:hypothetical protein